MENESTSQPFAEQAVPGEAPMQITASATYDRKTIKTFTRSNIFRKADPKKMLRLLIALLCIAFPMLVFAFFLDPDDTLLPTLAVWLLVIVLCLIFLYVVVPNLQYKALYKRADSTITYVFSEDSFIANTHGDAYSATSTFTYSNLYRVKETSKYLFLFIDKRQAFIVELSTMDAASSLLLRKKLRSVLGNAYLIYSF